eukprot:c2037_g1_i1 orf=56-226(+)
MAHNEILHIYTYLYMYIWPPNIDMMKLVKVGSQRLLKQASWLRWACEGEWLPTMGS